MALFNVKRVNGGHFIGIDKMPKNEPLSKNQRFMLQEAQDLFRIFGNFEAPDTTVEVVIFPSKVIRVITNREEMMRSALKSDGFLDCIYKKAEGRFFCKKDVEFLASKNRWNTVESQSLLCTVLNILVWWQCSSAERSNKKDVIKKKENRKDVVFNISDNKHKTVKEFANLIDKLGYYESPYLLDRLISFIGDGVAFEDGEYEHGTRLARTIPEQINFWDNPVPCRVCDGILYGNKDLMNSYSYVILWSVDECQDVMIFDCVQGKCIQKTLEQVEDAILEAGRENLHIYDLQPMRFE